MLKDNVHLEIPLEPSNLMEVLCMGTRREASLLLPQPACRPVLTGLIEPVHALFWEKKFQLDLKLSASLLGVEDPDELPQVLRMMNTGVFQALEGLVRYCNEDQMRGQKKVVRLSAVVVQIERLRQRCWSCALVRLFVRRFRQFSILGRVRDIWFSAPLQGRLHHFVHPGKAELVAHLVREHFPCAIQRGRGIEDDAIAIP